MDRLITLVVLTHLTAAGDLWPSHLTSGSCEVPPLSQSDFFGKKRVVRLEIVTLLAVRCWCSQFPPATTGRPAAKFRLVSINVVSLCRGLLCVSCSQLVSDWVSSHMSVCGRQRHPGEFRQMSHKISKPVSSWTPASSRCACLIWSYWVQFINQRV